VTPKVCITLPAYRAELTLAKTVADIPEGIADELILVDDHSPDNTAQLARELGIDVYVHPENRRYGGNQKTCYSRALLHGADIVVLLHPDYQYDPKAVPLLIAPILAGHADMTFGSRFAATGNPLAGGMPIYRFVGNRATTILENLFLGSRFTEMHSGLRAYTRRCLLSLPFLSYSDDFVFDSQLLIDAVTMGMRVVEVPIVTRYTLESSSVPIGASLRYVAGSVGYAVRRGRERGRRGRKSPLTLGRPPDLAPGSAIIAERRAQEPAAELQMTDTGGNVARRERFALLLDAAGWYWSRAARMLLVGTSDPQLVETATGRGWEVSPGFGEEAAPADVAVVVDPLETLPNPLAQLSSSGEGLSSEGLLVVGSPSSLEVLGHRGSSGDPRREVASATGLSGLLYGAGFRPVEWRRLPERCGQGVLVVARRD